MEKEEIIADLTYYYEVDIENCLMTHKDWITEIANALTDKEYLSKLKKEIKDYKDERNAMLCAVRPDLVDAGVSVPVGDTYIEDGTYQYRWVDDNRFQILLNGQWLNSYSTDFIFV